MLSQRLPSQELLGEMEVPALEGTGTDMNFWITAGAVQQQASRYITTFNSSPPGLAWFFSESLSRRLLRVKDQLLTS